MVFLSYTNKFYSLVASLKPTYRYLLTIGIVIAGLQSWLSFFYFPREEQINQYQRLIVQLHEQQLTFSSLQTSCSVLEQSVKQLHSSLNEHSYSSPDTMLQNMMFFIVDHAHMSGLSFNSCSLSKKEQKDWCIQDQIALDVNGDMQQLIHFLDALQTSRQAMHVDSIQLARQHNGLCSIRCTLQALSLGKKSPSTL